MKAPAKSATPPTGPAPEPAARSAVNTMRAMRGRPKGGLSSAASPPAEEDRRLRDLADAFLSRMTARAYAAGSVEAHGWALKYFLDWAAARQLRTPEAFTRPLLEEYQLFLHHFRSGRTGAPLAINTQLARLGVIRRFFAWLCRENLIPANPAADLDLPRKQPRLLPKSLAIEEIDRLLELPDLSTPFGLRDRAVLELFYATGIRRAEMVRLEQGDFDPALRTLHVRRGKGGKSRLLPVGERAADWLSRYLAEIRPLLAGQPGERTLFLSGYGSAFSPAYLGNWVARQMKKAGIEKKGSCHLFRHSCATHMLEGGADIRYIQQMLGHARLDTTQIYTEVSIRALAEAHARSHPHGKLPGETDTPPDAGNKGGKSSPLPSPPSGPIQASRLTPTAAKPSVPPREPDETGEPGEPTAARPQSGDPPIAPAGEQDDREPKPSPQPAGIAERVTDYAYRYLDTKLGRWISRDPIGVRGGLNLYAFVGNSGINLLDIFGLNKTSHPWVKTAGECGEKYIKEEHEAAKKHFNETGKRYEIVERCGRVCCKIEKGGEEYYCTVSARDTSYNDGATMRCDPGAAPRCNHGDFEKGFWHTHPGQTSIRTEGRTNEQKKHVLDISNGGTMSQGDRDFVDGKKGTHTGIHRNTRENPNKLPLTMTRINTNGKFVTVVYINGKEYEYEPPKK